MDNPRVNKAELENAVIDVAQRLYTRRLNTTLSGNVSARLFGSRILITPTGVDKGNLTERQLSLMDIKSETQTALEGMKPTSEFRVHTYIYRNMPDVNAVVHAHPSYSLAMVKAMGRDAFIKAVEERKEEYGYYVGKLASQKWMPEGSAEIAEAVAGAVKKGATVVIMEEHGTVGIGKTLHEALGRVESLEAIAEKLFITEMTKKNL